MTNRANGIGSVYQVRSGRWIAALNELNNFIESKNIDYKKVKVLTGLIFINIAALHHYQYSNLLFILGQEYLSESLLD